jgi:hypothetical protein
MKGAPAKPESRKKQRYDEINASVKNSLNNPNDEEWA